MMTFRLQAFLIVSMLFSGVPLHIGRSSSVTGTQERANGVNPLYPYDRQVGLTLTENFTTLAFNVSAVTQVGPEGLGPAYLLNGLSDSGYWYQVGLSWDWEASTGFRMNYEVFAPDGTS